MRFKFTFTVQFAAELRPQFLVNIIHSPARPLMFLIFFSLSQKFVDYIPVPATMIGFFFGESTPQY